MKNLRITGLIVILFLINSCMGKNNKNEETDKNEIKNFLLASDSWFKSKKEIYIFDYNEELSSNWNKTIIDWIKESSFFSKDFISRLDQEFDNDKHFGLYFYDYCDLGEMLKALCNEQEDFILNEIEKGPYDSYRYVTPWINVLNSFPDEEDTYLWMYERGDNGEEWQYSMIIIKEDGKWVIDKIERYFAVTKDVKKN